MKYLILIYSNPLSRQMWEAFSPDERAEGFKYYAALTEDLTASGELVVSEALADISTTKRVHVRDGQTLTTDGPFAEAKEHLMGIYLVQCDSLDRAIAVAARVPEAEYGLVEVRPVMNLSELDM
ncbi:MAG TPA: YciI family protein [Gemmatimonadales bacterium]|nr:YciI family protein [Gemmatimonadales bacterium]